MLLVSQYYQEKVVSLNKEDRYTRELPSREEDIKIEAELFCWRLYSGKKYIECVSEQEAQYLAVFLDAEVSRVEVPKDPEYLKEILPRLLHLKKRHDEIIQDRVDFLLRPKFMRKARYMIWQRIFSDEYVDFEKLEKEYEEEHPVQWEEDSEESDDDDADQYEDEDGDEEYPDDEEYEDDEYEKEKECEIGD
jgi:hypothetical protein